MEFLNAYAIVAYVDGPVARFTEDLRAELDPGARHNAHITVLPPRALECSSQEAIELAGRLVDGVRPVQVRAGCVEAFRDTQVIHLDLSDGAPELIALHEKLNTGCFSQQELYDYFPHITLAQNLAAGSIDGLLGDLRQRWQRFGPPPPMQIATLTLVRQRADGTWHDLARISLTSPGG